jgi:hypothetical protein
MAYPRLPSRIEQRRKFSSIRVDAGDIRSLATVAEETSQGEVILGGDSLMLLSDDMVYLEWDGGVGLGEAAEFAAFPGSLAHQGNKRPARCHSMAFCW